MWHFANFKSDKCKINSIHSLLKTKSMEKMFRKIKEQESIIYPMYSLVRAQNVYLHSYHWRNTFCAFTW